MIIENWKQLHKLLPEMTEGDLINAINYEVSTYRRFSILSRLHQRYTKLRSIRERDGLKNGQLIL